MGKTCNICIYMTCLVVSVGKTLDLINLAEHFHLDRPPGTSDILIIQRCL